MTPALAVQLRTAYARKSSAAGSLPFSRGQPDLYAAPGGIYHTGMKVLVSFNGGRSQWQTLQAPPPEGDVAAFAMAPGRFGVIAVAVARPGLDNIYRSASAGQTWTTYAIQGTGAGLRSGSELAAR